MAGHDDLCAALSADVRLGVHCGLKDIAQGPKSAKIKTLGY
jgi:hypothetical protein